MKRLLLLTAALALGACTVTTDVPRRVTIDTDKVVIHHDGHRYDHKHKHRDHKQDRSKRHDQKNKRCSYGQAKKGWCHD